MAQQYRSFLCRCFVSDRADACELPLEFDWTWDDLLRTAADEAVLPALSFAVHEGLDISAPSEVSEFLSVVFALHRERNEHIWQELKIAVHLLNLVGIEPVLLKGAAYLASGVYPNRAIRYLEDLDLLIPKSQSELAFQYLTENGYSYDAGDHLGRFRHHLPPLRRNSIALELHQMLGLGPCESILPADELIEHARLLELDEGLRVRIPAPSHLVTHLIMHSQIQHPYHERIWPPVRAMIDLYQLQKHLGSLIDWAEIHARFENSGYGDILHLHLIDVQDALCAVPAVHRQLSYVARLRRLRRRSLRNNPGLRYFDPIYMSSTVLLRRIRVVRRVLGARGGMRHLLRQLSTAGVCWRVLSDVVEGRGR